MQIVYISNRPGVLEETLRFVEHLMPFVSEALVFCPSDLREEFRLKSSISVRPVPEEDLLQGIDTSKVNLEDHQIMNWNLRSGLPWHQDVAEEFIMSDDDYRPLLPVDLSVFKDRGKYRSYYHYDLTRWPNYISQYDFGQHISGRVLESEGYSTLSFSSHMPQIIGRAIWRAAVERFKSYRELPLDEWSIYFNFAHKEFPYLFSDPSRHKTLCWTYPSPTRALSKPKEVLFENFYKHFYEPGEAFHGLPTRFSVRSYHAHTEEKLSRCRRMQLRSDIKRLLIWNSWKLSRAFGSLKSDITFNGPGHRIRISHFPRILITRSSTWLPIHLDISMTHDESKVDVDPGRLSYNWLEREEEVDSSEESKRGALVPRTRLDSAEVDFLVRSPARPGIHPFVLNYWDGERPYEVSEQFRCWMVTV